MWSNADSNFEYYVTPDSTNYVYKGSIGGSGGALAVTTTYTGSFSNTIESAEIKFDNAEEWSTTGSSSAYDVQSIAAHEFGHFLGLDHSNIYKATMYDSLGEGDTRFRTLAEDDKNGINAIY
ncbi:MAG: matrixin family metalloprotease [Candidatus Nanohaloarchaea archaeon]